MPRKTTFQTCTYGDIFIFVVVHTLILQLTRRTVTFPLSSLIRLQEQRSRPADRSWKSLFEVDTTFEVTSARLSAQRSFSSESELA